MHHNVALRHQLASSAVRRRLREYGYVEGQNLTLDYNRLERPGRSIRRRHAATVATQAGRTNRVRTGRSPEGGTGSDLDRDAFPAMRKATVFWDGLSADQWRATRDNAAKFGLDVAGVELKNYPYDYAGSGGIPA